MREWAGKQAINRYDAFRTSLIDRSAMFLSKSSASSLELWLKKNLALVGSPIPCHSTIPGSDNLCVVQHPRCLCELQPYHIDLDSTPSATAVAPHPI
jgi:hypothetical protein